MLITDIARQKRRPRVDVFVDDRLALSLSLTLVAQAGLRRGDDVTAERLEALRQADERQQAHDAALRLLASDPAARRSCAPVWPAVACRRAPLRRRWTICSNKASWTTTPSPATG